MIVIRNVIFSGFYVGVFLYLLISGQILYSIIDL